VWQAVRELAHGGTTVLLTTQYLNEADQLVDRIAILHEGRVLVNGTLAELKALMPPAQVERVEHTHNARPDRTIRHFCALTRATPGALHTVGQPSRAAREPSFGSGSPTGCRRQR